MRNAIISIDIHTFVDYYIDVSEILMYATPPCLRNYLTKIYITAAAESLISLYGLLLSSMYFSVILRMYVDKILVPINSNYILQNHFYKIKKYIYIIN